MISAEPMNVDRDKLVSLVGGLKTKSRIAQSLGEQAESYHDNELADDLYDIAYRMEVAARRFSRRLREMKREAAVT